MTKSHHTDVSARRAKPMISTLASRASTPSGSRPGSSGCWRGISAGGPAGHMDTPSRSNTRCSTPIGPDTFGWRSLRQCSARTSLNSRQSP